jgi:predicted short-subunit dehydrogenase-like oxidoreductase (DUF2520 family)
VRGDSHTKPPLGGGLYPLGVPDVRIIGPGRAGRSLAAALEGTPWVVTDLLGRDGPVDRAADGVDLLVIATPDRAVAPVAAAVAPGNAVVAHLAGSLGLDVLSPHDRRASIHPLVSMPSPEIGAARLRGAWYAVAGDPLAADLVAALDGTAVRVADEHRARYHAAACIAANHLVALFGQVERAAGPTGVPLEAYLDLARGTLDNIAALGPRAALTGPAARGDEATLAAHRAALPAGERELYDVLADACRRLAQEPPCAS